jgi:hypothetical protein
MRDFMPAEPQGGRAEAVEDCVSVWLVDDDKQDLSRVLAAIAATWQKSDNLDYVLFSEEHLSGAQVVVRETPGDTPDQGINPRHRDLIDMWASRVFRLTDLAWGQNVEIKRLPRSKVLDLLAESVHRGRILLEGIQPRLRNEVQRRLDSPAEDPRKPK